MKIKGVHLLLTYQCTLECEHCFVWGSPWQEGTISLQKLRLLLKQAQDIGTVEWFYFEGGEPFLYYPILLRGVQEAASLGFKTGIVSNAYWAVDEGDALEWLSPFRGLIQDLSVSSDTYHWNAELHQRALIAQRAADQLDIPIGIISVAKPGAPETSAAAGQLPIGESGVMFRGRAAESLASKAHHQPWSSFTECPYENLVDPGRVHIDPLGNVHICQGISLGNVFQSSLVEIAAAYDPGAHPITSPIIQGGPVELVRRYDLPHSERYADACHLCDEARRGLRDRFPEILMPDQMYGVPM